MFRRVCLLSLVCDACGCQQCLLELPVEGGGAGKRGQGVPDGGSRRRANDGGAEGSGRRFPCIFLLSLLIFLFPFVVFVIVRLFSFCFSSLHFFFLAFLSFPCTMAGDAMPMLTMMSTRAFWLTLGAYALVVVLGAGLGFGLCLSTALSCQSLSFHPIVCVCVTVCLWRCAQHHSGVPCRGVKDECVALCRRGRDRV